jgi:hypothetical protein
MKMEQSKMFELLRRFPDVSLPYESTVTPTNVTRQYDVYLEIPRAKKYFVWFTYYGDSNVCFLLELNKERAIVSATHILNVEFDRNLSFGTILYGSVIENNTIDSNFSQQSFIVEDILMFKGINLNTSFLIEKLNYIIEVIKLIDQSDILFSWSLLKNTFTATSTATTVHPPPPDISVPLYPVHHYQYRSFSHKCPYLNSKTPEPLNVFIETAINAVKPIKGVQSYSIVSPTVKNYSKPQYRLKTTFLISAESIYDIYSLFAVDKCGQMAFYDYAYIPNLKSSVYMNNHFRNIKENRNIDYIEESDDEDDFQNTDCNKYVELKKRSMFDCVFHNKFKRWIPIRLVEGTNHTNKVVQLKKLVI